MAGAEQKKTNTVTDTDGGITTEIRDRVFLIGLDRPSKKNALTPKMIALLGDAYRQFEDADDLRCAILFGHGNAYCAGFDLTKLEETTTGDGLKPIGSAIDPFGLSGPPLGKPLIVAVHGLCFAGGFEVALNSDIIVAANDTLFGQPEVQRGIFAFGGATMRWIQRAGWGNSQRYLLTGDVLDAQEAFRLGLVQEVVEPGQQLNRAVELATKIAEAAPLGIRGSLEASRLFLAEGPDVMAARVLEQQGEIMRTEDAREGVKSFLERRKGDYVGR